MKDQCQKFINTELISHLNVKVYIGQTTLSISSLRIFLINDQNVNGTIYDYIIICCNNTKLTSDDKKWHNHYDWDQF